MRNRTLEKVDLYYVLFYVLAPAAFAIVVTFLIHLLPIRNLWILVGIGMFILCLVFWSLASSRIFALQLHRFEQQLDRQGFRRNYTFQSEAAALIIDINTGKVALIFLWSPFHPIVINASRIDKIWVDDGKFGLGPFATSKRVRFNFQIGKRKIRINTFSSNRPWRMDTDYILTGISKADMMAELLDRAARRNAQ